MTLLFGIGIFFVWVALAMMVADAAAKRGRSVFGWLVLAIFISPLLAGMLLWVLPHRVDLLPLTAEPLRPPAKQGTSQSVENQSTPQPEARLTLPERIFGQSPDKRRTPALEQTNWLTVRVLLPMAVFVGVALTPLFIPTGGFSDIFADGPTAKSQRQKASVQLHNEVQPERSQNLELPPTPQERISPQTHQALKIVDGKIDRALANGATAPMSTKDHSSIQIIDRKITDGQKPSIRYGTSSSPQPHAILRIIDGKIYQ